jgi:hypothetical protein
MGLRKWIKECYAVMKGLTSSVVEGFSPSKMRSMVARGSSSGGVAALLGRRFSVTAEEYRSSLISVVDPALLRIHPYVFGPPGSGSISQIYGSGSFYHQTKIVRKRFIPTVLYVLYSFYLGKKVGK